MWYETPAGLTTHRSDWRTLGVSLLQNTLPPIADAYLGDWRMGLITVGLTVLVIS